MPDLKPEDLDDLRRECVDRMGRPHGFGRGREVSVDAAVLKGLLEVHAGRQRVETAIRDFHFALDSRQHGDVAAHKALSAIQQALGMEWRQGEEKKRREAERAAQAS